MSDPEAVVTAMMEACCRRDFDAVLACFHEDACYHNMPMAPVHGHAAIRALLEPFLSTAKGLDWVVHHSLSNGTDLVMNERTDRFLRDDGWVDLPVVGVFEVRDGRISHWRDYFDMAGMAKLMA